MHLSLSLTWSTDISVRNGQALNTNLDTLGPLHLHLALISIIVTLSVPAL